MSLLKTIDGSSWTDGWAGLNGIALTANGSNSGSAAGNQIAVASVAGGGNGWTFRAMSADDLADPVLADCDANGYLEGTTGAACTLQAQATGTACPATGNDYWLRVYLRLATTGAALPGSSSGIMHQVATGGNSLSWYWTLNGVATPCPGFGYTIAEAGSINGSAASLWAGTGITSPTMLLDQWYEVTIHWHRAATPNGYTEMFVNRRKVCVWSGAELNDAGIVDWAAQAINFRAPAFSGTKVQIARMECWDGVDIDMVPMYSLDDGQPVTKVLMPAFATIDTSPAHGLDWQWNAAGLALSTEYAAIAGSPYRRFFTCTSGTPTASTCQNLGTLPYNEQGWATLVFADISVPAGSIVIALKDAANAVNLMRYAITGGTIYTLDASGNAANMIPSGLTAAVRYTLMLHFNLDGRATWTLLDLTTDLQAAARGAWSGPLPDWTPQALGKCTIAFSWSSGAIDVGALAVASRPSIAMLDSLSTNNYSTPAPDIRTPYTICGALPTIEERQCVPGGYWNQREAGMSRRLIVTTCGQAGLSRRRWDLNILPNLIYTRGCEFICADGGCINDITAVTVDVNETTSLDVCKRSLTKMFDLLLEGDNAIWITTVMQRSRSASVTGIIDNGSGLCRIQAVGHGVPGATFWPRIVSTSPGSVTPTAIAAIDASNGLDVTAVAADYFDINVPIAIETLDNAVVVILSADQEAMRVAINEHIRYLVAAKQRQQLVRFSDIDADMTANPATYPNTLGTSSMWSDGIHPQAWSPSAVYTNGSWIVAKRMVQTRVIPPTNPVRRRWPLRLLGR